MKQTTLASTGFELVTKRTRKREFLEEMNLVVPWTYSTGLIKPFAPASKTGRPPFPIVTMLRIHFIQQWFSLYVIQPWKRPCTTWPCFVTSPSSMQAIPVRLSQDSVSEIDQKHGATDNTVCAEQLVDGEKTNYSGACGMSTPAAWANAQKKIQIRP